MPKIKEAPDGERTSVDGTEALPLSSSDSVSSWWTPISRIAEYIRTLTQTLTGKTVNLSNNTLTGTTAQFNTANSDGDFATLAGSETLTNKTLTSPTINTPILTVNDNSLSIRDNGDTTKIVQFEASGVTTGTTRTLTVPNANTTLVGTDATQTLTNKTLTAPTIADFTNMAHDHQDPDDGGQLAEAALSLSDNTTNDVSTTKHGFTPKAPNDTTKFLRGDASWNAPSGGFSLNVDTTPVGNVGSGEDNLISYSVPANTLDTNGQYIHFRMSGTFAASVNNKRIRVKLGSTTLFDTGALAITAAGDWDADGYIIRTGSATQKCIVHFNSNETALTGSADYVDATEDLTTILALKATGEATDNDDIIQKFLVVEKGGGSSSSGGGRTLIAEVTPSGVSTIQVATSISGTYKKLTLEFAIRSTQSATSVDMDIELNNDTTDANYRKTIYYGYAASSLGAVGAANNSLGDMISAANSPSNSFTIGIIEIPQYANTNFNKHILCRGSHRRDDSSVFELTFVTAMEWENTAAITEIDLTLSAGNFVANSVIRLYGES